MPSSQHCPSPMIIRHLCGLWKTSTRYQPVESSELAGRCFFFVGQSLFASWSTSSTQLSLPLLVAMVHLQTSSGEPCLPALGCKPLVQIVWTPTSLGSRSVCAMWLSSSVSTSRSYTVIRTTNWSSRSLTWLIENNLVSRKIRGTGQGRVIHCPFSHPKC